MSAPMHTPGPLFVKQQTEFPFNILTVDQAGNEIFFDRRNAYGTGQETVADVMAGSCFSNPETRAAAIESNGRQLADAYLRAAAPELLAALIAIAEFIPNTSTSEGGAAKYSQNVRAADMVRAAIARATGVAK